MNLFKATLSLLTALLVLSCAGTQSMSNSSDTHYYSASLEEAVDKTREALEETDVEVANHGYEGEDRYEFNITVTRRGVAGSERIQLYNGLVELEKVGEGIVRVHVQDRIARPATVSRQDYKDYTGEILRRVDEKLTSYKNRVIER